MQNTARHKEIRATSPHMWVTQAMDYVAELKKQQDAKLHEISIIKIV